MTQASPSAACLSATERRILLLVMSGRRGKEIAPIVGTSYDMVEKHIKAAREKLGGVTRIEAARIVAASEDNGPVQFLDLQKTDLSRPPHVTAVASGDHEQPEASPPQKGFPWPLPTAGRPTNELSFVQRWGWILVLAVAFALLSVGLVASTGSLLGYLARHFLPGHSYPNR